MRPLQMARAKSRDPVALLLLLPALTILLIFLLSSAGLISD